jgi:hypothetical protein
VASLVPRCHGLSGSAKNTRLRAVLPGTRVRPSLSPDRRSRFCAAAWAHAVRIHAFETPGNLLGRATLGQMRPHVLPQPGVQEFARTSWLTGPGCRQCLCRAGTIGSVPLTNRILCFSVHPSYNTPPCEAPMPFTLRPYRRFPVHCAVTYNTGCSSSCHWPA